MPQLTLICNIVYVVYLAMILIWQFGESCKGYPANCMPLTYHLYCKHGFLQYSTQSANLKIPPIVLFE